MKRVRMNSPRQIVAALLLMAAAAWGSLSLELQPQQPEQGSEFTLSLISAVGDLPPDYQQPELEFSADHFQLLASSSKEESRRDFFAGRYRVKRFDYQLKALREGRHKIDLFWHYSGERHAIGSTQVAVQRSIDAAGLTISAYSNKKELWEGEQLTLTIQLNAYQNFRQELGAASLDFGSGFWGGLADQNPEWKRTDGSKSAVATRTLTAHLVPMRAGEQTIPSISYRYLKEGRMERKVEEKKTAFGMMRSERITQEPQEAVAQSRPIALQVKPLPQEGRPAHFSGLVGRYSLSAKLSADSTQIGSPISLEVEVSGNGRPGATPQLQLPDLRDFRQVPPEESLTQRVRQGGKWTTWKAKWFLYPRRPGSFEIAGVQFSYFDPSTGRYKTAQTAPMKVVVSRGAAGEEEQQLGALSAPAPVAQQSKEIRQLGSDIRYIQSDGSRLRDQFEWPHQQLRFWLLLVWLLLLPLWAAGGRALYRRTLLDPDRQRRSRARAAVRAQLREAAAAREAAQAHPFYNALERALLEGVGEALGGEPRGMARHAIARGLLAHGLEGNASQQIVELLKECDAARFAASSIDDSSAHRQQLLQQAEELLYQLRRVRS